MSGFFAFLGLLLSGIGVYGLAIWNVTRRTTEIGLRMALGATRMEVFHLVMRQVMRLLAVGLLAGGLGALFAARVVRNFLSEISPAIPSSSCPRRFCSPRSPCWPLCCPHGVPCPSIPCRALNTE
ncbi:FtsX-like permease family protein [Tunturiibacter gelidoferens]|uniref:FtsX-like permease family protein n=1 Tax=Tunturiibacter gelidiferens TaxID=3069689 RepID=UPI003872BB81